MGIHEALAERLASLKLGALGIGAEHGDAGLAQLVGHARDERRLGADDHELHVVLLHERQHRAAVLDGKIGHVARDIRRAAVAGGHVELVRARGLRKRPRDGMLAAAAAQHQDVHCRSFQNQRCFT